MVITIITSSSSFSVFNSYFSLIIKIFVSILRKLWSWKKVVSEYIRSLSIHYLLVIRYPVIEKKCFYSWLISSLIECFGSVLKPCFKPVSGDLRLHPDFSNVQGLKLCQTSAGGLTQQRLYWCRSSHGSLKKITRWLFQHFLCVTLYLTHFLLL